MSLQRIRRDLWLWRDTCNVYVFKDDEHALLIDLGDGSVLDHLDEIGVQKVEWILFTHHHREQCQGAPRLSGRGIKLAAPAAERAFFERPTDFRKLEPTLGDAHSVYGASYVRPPIQPIAIDHTFERMDDFTWRGRELWCLDTSGNSPGSMTYMLKADEGWLAFSGDLMLADARLHTWFDSEWDYGFAEGIYALYNAASRVEAFDPAYLLPSHGPVVERPARQLAEYREKLRELEKRYLRGYELFTFAEGTQDTVSKPTNVPHVWQITEHLFKFKGPDFWPNFTLLLADNGHALVVDCGLLDESFLDMALTRMQQRLGLKQIDAIIVTHMHGDHFLQAPFLRDKWGAELWTMDRVAPICEHPERYDYAAPINTYGQPFKAVEFDRILRDGETFGWEGYTFTVDWMPGQTEFALCMHGEIDGHRVAFTGDNIFASTTDPTQVGHEAVVARNSCILEESYIYAGNYLHALGPDLILGGHCWVLDEPKQLIERYRDNALALREAYRALSREDDYRYMFDPYWVRAYPYRVHVKPGERVDLDLIVRNFRKRNQSHAVRIATPSGLTAEPAVIEGDTPAEATNRTPFTIRASADVPEGVHVVAFDITRDGERHGQMFDMIVHVADQPPQSTTDRPDA